MTQKLAGECSSEKWSVSRVCAITRGVLLIHISFSKFHSLKLSLSIADVTERRWSSARNAGGRLARAATNGIVCAAWQRFAICAAPLVSANERSPHSCRSHSRPSVPGIAVVEPSPRRRCSARATSSPIKCNSTSFCRSVCLPRNSTSVSGPCRPQLGPDGWRRTSPWGRRLVGQSGSRHAQLANGSSQSITADLRDRRRVWRPCRRYRTTTMCGCGSSGVTYNSHKRAWLNKLARLERPSFTNGKREENAITRPLATHLAAGTQTWRAIMIAGRRSSGRRVNAARWRRGRTVHGHRITGDSPGKRRVRYPCRWCRTTTIRGYGLRRRLRLSQAGLARWIDVGGKAVVY